MSRPRAQIRMISSLAFGLGLVGLVAGCDSGTPKSGTTVYSGPEEIAAKNQELKNAMQGGAYGAAGKKAAGSIKP